jgi:ABC-type uncharacterized transport system auxiliary subunit
MIEENMVKHLVISILFLMSLVSCSSDEADSNVFDTQVEAIDRANEVEDQILDAAERQRRAIEESTQ